LEGTRAQNFAAIEGAISFAQKYQSQSQNKSQTSLFEMLGDDGDENSESGFMTYPPLPDVPDWLVQEMLEREKELLGFYISGHPLDKYAKEIELFSNLNWNDPQTYAAKKEVSTAAIISQSKTHIDRKGNIMAFITLEDRHNSFEGVVFASVYEKYGNYINKGEMVFVKGKVSDPGDQTFKMLCDEVIPLGEVRNRMSHGLQLVVNTNTLKEEEIARLQEIIRQHPGTIPLFFEMRVNGNDTGFILKSKKYRVVVTDEFLSELQSLLGKQNVFIKN